MRIFLTGATGFLGQHLLWSFLQRSSDADAVYCLIRAGNQEQADQRLTALLQNPGAPRLSAAQHARAHAVHGDITDPSLGLSHAGIHFDGPTRIVHCAATVRFNESLDSARRINVGGTRHVLQWAEQLHRDGNLERFDYIGTAFVAGRTRGLAPEDRLLEQPEFHNTYEQTKWEAEALLREHQADLPVAIYRPSIIVGDSDSGYTANYRVLYAPLKLLAQGVALFAPAADDGIVDVVPVDYVVRAFTALSSSRQSLGRSYHLAAGPRGQSTIAELVDMASKFFRVRKPLLISPSLWLPILKPFFYVAYAALWGERRAQLDRVSHYFPYFAYRASFATDAASADLEAHGLQPPSVADYFGRLMQFCIDTQWGAKPPPHRHAQIKT